MKRHLFVGFMVLISLGISVLFLPRESELNLMHMKNRQFDHAKVEFEKQFQAGDRSVSVSAPLTDLYTYYGEIDKAIEVLENFLRAHPQDHRARLKLANFYRDEQRTDDYLFQLEKLTYQQPSEEGFRKLNTLYEEKGQPEMQLQSLGNLVNRYPGKMEDYVTLAYLQANHGKLSDALQTLQSLDSRHSAPASPEKEELHISLLLDRNKPKQAKDQAVRWLNHNYNNAAFSRFLDVFKSREHQHLSLQLLKNFEGEVELDAELLQLLVELEVQDGKSQDALNRLVRLFKSDRLPGLLALNLIELLIDPEMLNPQKKSSTGKRPAPNPGQLSAENLKLAKSVLSKFGEEFLTPRPLLAAELMFALKDEASALRWIQKAETLPVLNLDQKIALANLYGKLGRSSKKYTADYGKRLRDRILTELKAPKLPESRREELVFAMLELNAAKQTLPHLKRLALKKGGDWIYLYERTLLKLGRKREITDFWRKRAKQSGLPVEEKRLLAYQLLENGKKSDAEKVFKELAAKSSAKSPDVEQLLYLWGPRPRRDARMWLLSRAKKSKGNERAEWMKHLIRAGGVQDVMRLDATNPPASITDGFFSVYLLALEKLEDDKDFTFAVRRFLKSEKRPNRLFRYGMLAEDRDQLDIAQAAYTRMLENKPNDQRALKNLGRLSFHQGQWQEAQNYLSRLLKKNKTDWEANYYFAEAGFLQGNENDSLPYFKQALKGIRAKPNKTLSMQMMQANCLHRVGQEKEALALFELLLKEHPNDNEIRNDIVSALLQTGNMARAQQLMIPNN